MGKTLSFLKEVILRYRGKDDSILAQFLEQRACNKRPMRVIRVFPLVPIVTILTLWYLKYIASSQTYCNHNN